jgi:Ran GTPase-activating protein (RanGAP) involved in mRNA processing and transport
VREKRTYGDAKGVRSMTVSDDKLKSIVLSGGYYSLTASTALAMAEEIIRLREELARYKKKDGTR